jgi:hypothetical protein
MLLLPQLLRPNHQLGRDRDLRLLEACVLAKVLMGVIDTEPLQWLGPAALVEAWVGCWSCTSGKFLKVGCSGTLSMVERV